MAAVWGQISVFDSKQVQVAANFLKGDLPKPNSSRVRWTIGIELNFELGSEQELAVVGSLKLKLPVHGAWRPFQSGLIDDLEVPSQKQLMAFDGFLNAMQSLKNMNDQISSVGLFQFLCHLHRGDSFPRKSWDVHQYGEASKKMRRSPTV
ncbi:MAG: hypothetical protein V9F46_02020 [Chitinophagaceae bacterium]